MANLRFADDDRPLDELRRQYEFERAFAARLRGASPEERATLYCKAYDELHLAFPDHPLLKTKDEPAFRRYKAWSQMRILQPYLRPGMTFVELGAGDCCASFAAAEAGAEVYAVEVSAEITRGLDPPPNFHLAISNGTNIPLPDASVDLVYSSNLMEHLHPDDAKHQLREVHRVLRPGGTYVLLTPNRIHGPWDVSRYFADSAQGLHLREYSNGELLEELRAAGFRPLGSRRRKLPFLLPVRPIIWLESALLGLPPPLRRRIGMWRPVHYLLDVCLIARK